MAKNFLRVCLVLFIFLSFEQSALSFSLPFKKKYNKEKEASEPMVQTKEEWLESATSVNMELREQKEEGGVIDEAYNPPEAEIPVYIEKYNVAAGSKEIDLSDITRKKVVRSVYVADPDIKKAGYTESYLYAQTGQVASVFYVIDLDTSLSKKERLKQASIFENKRIPLISTALSNLREDFFSSLTIVDFSSDGKNVLLKEKLGSAKNGIYETYVWIYFLEGQNKEDNACYNNNRDFNNTDFDFFSLEKNFKNNDKITELDVYASAPKASLYEYNSTASTNNEAFLNENPKTRWHKSENLSPLPDTSQDNDTPKSGFGVRLNLLNQTIKNYWLDRQNLILNHIKWDLTPLGFNSNNDKEIIVKAYTWNNQGKKVSLGLWGVNLESGIPRLILENEEISIEANALYLVKKINE